MRNDRVARGYMGNGWSPPNYPSHNFKVEININRRKEYRDTSNIEYALEQECVSTQTKGEIRYLIKEWEANTKLPLESTEVQKWITFCKELLGCDATEHIQKYYPDFKDINI